MKNIFYISFVLLLLPKLLFPQQYKTFEEMVDKVINHTIPLIKVEKIITKQNKFLFLDAREKKEYSVSHIKNAQWIGFDYPNFSSLKNISFNTPLIVYCSVGYRSEKMAEKLKAMGYKNVFNLYGGIFNWSNNNYPLFDNANKQTKIIHGFSENWGKWLLTKSVVYE